MPRTGQSRSLLSAWDFMFAEAEWVAVLGRERLTEVEAVLALDRGRVVARSRTTRTVTIPSAVPGGPALFVTLYFFPTWRDVLKGLFRGTLLGRPRAQKLWRVLHAMREVAISAVEPVAFGTRRIGLFLRAAFVVTAEPAPGSISLDRLPLAWRRDAAAYAERRVLLRRLAASTRSLHEAGFVHKDLFLRNIVLSRSSDGPRFHFLDCPKGSFSSSVRPLRGAALDDLATLDAGASVVASRAERLRFLLAYAGVSRVSADVRRAVAVVRAKEERLVAKERGRMLSSTPWPAPDAKRSNACLALAE